MLQTPSEYHIPLGEDDPAPSRPTFDGPGLEVDVNPVSVNNEAMIFYRERAKRVLEAETNLRDRIQINQQASAIETARQYEIDSRSSVYERRRLRSTFGGKIFRTLVGVNLDKLSPLVSSKDLTLRELIQQESLIGAEIFGTPIEGGQYTFFLSDAREWVWHQASDKQYVTTRYIVQADGILKIQDGAPQYELLEGQELKNFILATDAYHGHVMNRMYKNSQQTDHEQAA